MNYIEREVAGLRPDVALIAAAKPHRGIQDYTGRLRRALGRPRVVIATHWDNQGLPFGAAQEEALAEVATFIAEVKAIAPRTHVILPAHFQTIVLDERGRHAKSVDRTSVVSSRGCGPSGRTPA